MCHPDPPHVAAPQRRSEPGERVAFPSGEIEVRAQLFLPRSRPAPPVVVLHDLYGGRFYFGLGERLATEGYAVLVPNLFERQGNLREQNLMAAAERGRGLEDRHVAADLDAALDWMTAQSWCRPGRAGLVGFCMGGRLAMLNAGNTRVGACVSFYGRTDGRATPGQPRSPRQTLPGVETPLLALFAGRDEFVPLQDSELLAAAMARGEVRGQVHLYPEAPHAFFMDREGRYQAETDDAWTRVLGFLGAHLGEAAA